MSNKPTLVLDSVSLYYHTKCVLERISFTLNQGESLVILGKNGSGKSSLIKILSGLLCPYKGSVFIQGESLWRKGVSRVQAKRHLSYLPESDIVYPEFTVIQYALFVYRVYHSTVAYPKAYNAVSQALDQFGLGFKKNQGLLTLSKGLRRRLSILVSLMQNTPLLLLDEPTDGLDIEQKQQLYRLLNTTRQDRALVFSSHDLKEAESLSTHVLIMKQGKINFFGSVADLRQQVSSHTLELTVELGVTFNCLRLLKAIASEVSEPLSMVIETTQEPEVKRMLSSLGLSGSVVYNPHNPYFKVIIQHPQSEWVMSQLLEKSMDYQSPLLSLQQQMSSFSQCYEALA